MNSIGKQSLPNIQAIPVRKNKFVSNKSEALRDISHINAKKEGKKFVKTFTDAQTNFENAVSNKQPTVKRPVTDKQRASLQRAREIKQQKRGPIERPPVDKPKKTEPVILNNKIRRVKPVDIEKPSVDYHSVETNRPKNPGRIEKNPVDVLKTIENLQKNNSIDSGISIVKEVPIDNVPKQDLSIHKVPLIPGIHHNDISIEAPAIESDVDKAARRLQKQMAMSKNNEMLTHIMNNMTSLKAAQDEISMMINKPVNAVQQRPDNSIGVPQRRQEQSSRFSLEPPRKSFLHKPSYF